MGAGAGLLSTASSPRGPSGSLKNGVLFPEVERNIWSSSNPQWQFLYLEHPSNPPKLPLPQTDVLPPPSHTLTPSLTHTTSLPTCPYHVLLSAHFKNWIAYLVLSRMSFLYVLDTVIWSCCLQIYSPSQIGALFC